MGQIDRFICTLHPQHYLFNQVENFDSIKRRVEIVDTERKIRADLFVPFLFLLVAFMLRLELSKDEISDTCNNLELFPDHFDESNRRDRYCIWWFLQSIIWNSSFNVLLLLFLVLYVLMLRLDIQKLHFPFSNCLNCIESFYRDGFNSGCGQFCCSLMEQLPHKPEQICELIDK